MEAKFGDVSNFIWGSDVGVTSSGRYFWKIEGEIPQQEPSKYVILNAAVPTDVNKVVELSSNVANKVFKKNMRKSGIKGWGVATKIADSNKVEIPLGKLSQELLKNTIDEFGEDADMSNVALTYEKLTGAKIRP